MAYVLDTSVIIERAVTKLIEDKKIKGKILVPRAVISELENQANTGRDTGLIGLEELQKMQEFAKKNIITLEIVGERPNLGHIKYAKKGGEIDSLIKEIAFNEGATLITADLVQSESAKAVGVEVMFIQLKVSEVL